MQLKSGYYADVTYNEGDVVPFEGAGYIAKEQTIGIPPTVERVWRRLDQELWDVIDMILDAQEAAITAATAVLDSRISEDAIVLKGAGDEPKEYVITVDESGDDPELAVTEVTEEAGT